MNYFRLFLVAVVDIAYAVIAFQYVTSRDWGVASNFTYTAFAMPILVITFLGLVWSDQ